MPHVFSHDVDAPVETVDDGRSASQAARQVAVAITLLMVSFLVLTRSHSALGSGVAATSRITAGTVELTDDDGGKTLFELPALQPGDVISNCITVTFRGSVFDEVVGLRFRGGGPLAPHLVTTIEIGRGGSFDSCDGFARDETLFRGSLAELHDLHGPSSPALDTFRIERTPDTRTFRITFALDDAVDASGQDASTDFLWSVGD
jgi:hypothetical protein